MMRFVFLFLLALLITPLIAPSVSHALSIDNIRLGSYPDKTRIVIDLDQHTEYHSFILANPPRIVVDLPKVTVQTDTFNALSSQQIESARIGDRNQAQSRLVFDLNDTAIIDHVFQLPASGEKPDRLVLDIKPASAEQFLAATNKKFGTLGQADLPKATYKIQTPRSDIQPFPIQVKKTEIFPDPETLAQIQAMSADLPFPVPTKKPSVPENLSQQSTAYTPPKRIQKPLIVIDPGHGGQDPGAVAQGKIYEKDIVLSLSKKLRDELNKSGKYRVKMTRDSDIFVRLRDRVKFAHDLEADLFISVHADSLPKSNARGASFYTLSETASDKQTAALAERENKADIIAGIDLSGEDKEVASILMDLVMRDTMNQSKFFANSLVTAFQRAGIRILENPHRYAGFAVLKAPDVPSVLVEAGFISNRQEARLLIQKDHQRNIARALKGSIDLYFETLEENQRL